MIACVSVDLDGLLHYARIHGLPEASIDARARGLALEVALPRFLALFRENSVPATFFAIGEDAETDVGRVALAAAVSGGHELASHSHRHDYALSRASAVHVDADFAAAERALEAISGEHPVGFRAPGYALSSTMLGVLVQRGYRYDASVFPSAPYHAAKALVMGALALFGRPSGAILDRPAVLRAPRHPYAPDISEPYREGGAPLVEIPMTVTPVLRVPFIGTLVTAAPRPLLAATLRALGTQPWISLELHAVDLLEPADGIPDALVRAQPDLRIPVERKRARLTEVLGWLRGRGSCVTLARAAEKVASSS